MMHSRVSNHAHGARRREFRATERGHSRGEIPPAGVRALRAGVPATGSPPRLELRDNGAGFLVNQTNGAGFGLIGMRERAERIGGTLTIASEPGAGTTIIAVSPYEQAKL